MPQTTEGLDGLLVPQCPPPIRARLLGQLEIDIGDRRLSDRDWQRRSARSLFLFLLLTPGKTALRDVVTDVLWPDSAPDAARNALYVALHSLRRVLEPELGRGKASSYIDVRAETIRILPIPGSQIDVEEFELGIARSGTLKGLERRTILKESISLYRGDLLADDVYADWPVTRRESLRQSWEKAIIESARLELSEGDPSSVITTIESLLAADGTHEEAHQILIKTFLTLGQIDRARRQYELCATTLMDVLNESPSRDTEALVADLRSPGRELPGAARDGFHIHVLPVPLTALVGRDRELEELKGAMLDPQTRLLTLTGPGGIGKTHLAMVVAAALSDEFSGGVAFVALSALQDPLLLLPTIAHTLGIHVNHRQSDLLERICFALADVRILLILDNFEQIIDGAPVVADLLRLLPNAKILATSRERLRLRGERVRIVPPLPTIDPARSPSPAMLARNEAVAMLCDRIHSSDPTFIVNQVNSAAIASICHRLDGIPLAIELASTWYPIFPIEELAERLVYPLDLLAFADRDLPERHHSMRSAIAWSYGLLKPSQQQLFALIAFFSDGFTTEAVESVASVLHQQLRLSDSEVALDAQHPIKNSLSTTIRDLSALHAHSLIVATQKNPETRWTMLETIRAFALEQLESSGVFRQVSSAHADWYTKSAEDAEVGLEGNGSYLLVERLERDLGNYRTAIRWGMANETAIALRISVSLARFWEFAGLLTEGQDLIERALDTCTKSEPGPLAHACCASGSIALLRGNFELARLRLNQAIDIAEEIGATRTLGRALVQLGYLEHHIGRYEDSRRLLLRGLSHCSDSGDEWGKQIASVDLILNDYFLGNREDVETRTTNAIAEAEKIGNTRLLTRILIVSGQLSTWSGDGQIAIARASQALTLATNWGDHETAARAHLRLGEACGFVGETDTARVHLDAALRTFRRSGRKFQVAAALFYRGSFGFAPESLNAVADLQESARLWIELSSIHLLDTTQAIARCAMHRERPGLAVQMLAAVQARRDEMKSPLRVEYFQRDFEHSIYEAKNILTEEEFSESWSIGLQTPLETMAQRFLNFT